VIIFFLALGALDPIQIFESNFIGHLEVFLIGGTGEHSAPPLQPPFALLPPVQLPPVQPPVGTSDRDSNAANAGSDSLPEITTRDSARGAEGPIIPDIQQGVEIYIFEYDIEDLIDVASPPLSEFVLMFVFVLIHIWYS